MHADEPPARLCLGDIVSRAACGPQTQSGVRVQYCNALRHSHLRRILIRFLFAYLCIFVCCTFVYFYIYATAVYLYGIFLCFLKLMNDLNRSHVIFHVCFLNRFLV